MKSKSWFRMFGRDAELGDVMEAVRAEHGKGASGWLAKTLGVSQRQARRYLAGSVHKPGRKAAPNMGKVNRATSRKVAADQLRRVQTVNPGRVRVNAISPKVPVPDGKRNIPSVDVSAVMEEVADLYEQGREDEAAELFDDAVMERYGGGDVHARDGLSAVLRIDDYQEHISYTQRADDGPESGSDQGE